MAFVVSFNGQFQRYSLPDLSKLLGPRKLQQIRYSSKSSMVDELESNMPEYKAVDHKNIGLKSGFDHYKKVENQKREEKKVSFAYEIMSKPVKTLGPKDKVIDARRLMELHDFKHVPITQEDKILGIVSDRDIYPLDLKKNEYKLETVMSKNVIAAWETTTISDIAKIMLLEKISAIPIINDNHSMVGIIGRSDILKCVMHNLPLEFRI